MWDMNSIIEALLRLFVVMIPVAGVILLFVAAHVMGGAMKSRNRSASSSQPMSTPQNGSAPAERRHGSQTKERERVKGRRLLVNQHKGFANR